MAGLLLLGALGGSPGCAVGPRLPEFATPEAVVRSYVRAFLEDDPAREYRCLAETFKDRHGATLERYIHFRGQVEDSLGAARTWARLGLVRPQIAAGTPTEDAPERSRSFDVETWGWHARFRVEPEGWFRVVPAPPAEAVEATVGPLGRVLHPRQGGLDVRLEDPELGRIEAGTIREVRLAEDWKIADIQIVRPRAVEP